MKFKLYSDYAPAGDQPKAIKVLDFETAAILRDEIVELTKLKQKK